VFIALAVLVLATEGRFFYDLLPPLLLVEHPFAVDESVATVPLVLMAQDRLHVMPVTDVQITGYSLTQPLVTLQAPGVSGNIILDLNSETMLVIPNMQRKSLK
jgi:hypothetical protein